METQTVDIPDDIKQLAEIMRAEKSARIEALGKEAAKKRDLAVMKRLQSGIEKIWDEDDEYYEGIDDANRKSFNYSKSASSTGGLVRNSQQGEAARCVAFFNITRQFVDSAAARMGDILLPAGDWNFSLKPSPVAELPFAPPTAQPDSQGFPPPVESGAPLDTQAEAEKVNEKAENRIKDWLVEGRYHAEVRKAIEDAARIGTGILKGPFPRKRRIKVMEGDALVVKTETCPVSERIDPRDFFPDPNCGDDIHNGSFVVQREVMSARQLRDLKEVDGYLRAQIDKVLEEGPSKRNVTDVGNNDVKLEDDDSFEVWYFYGDIDVDDLYAAGTDVEGIKRNSAPAVVVLVNDTAIKAFINPLESGEFPFDVMPWQRMDRLPWGIGVARQGRTPQDMLNASARALMDNAGISSGPNIVIRDGAVYPADGNWTITARKVWRVTEQAEVRSVADAIQPIVIPSVQGELNGIIQLAYKMMEDATGIMYLLQGQQGAAPDTVGGMELLNRNASALLRRLARVFDEHVTEPHIRRYYEWLLMYGEDDEKGDLQIEAVGSSALVERELQAQEALALLNMSLQPAFGIDPEKAVVEVLKAKRMIPDKWMLDDAKKQQLAQQQAPPAPQVQAAQIRAEVDKFKAEKAAATAEFKTRVDMDRDTLYAQTMAERDKTSAELRIEELKITREKSLIDRELQLLKYANDQKISLEQVKAQLAQTAMKLRTQKDLSRMRAGQITTPPTEPAGRAENGRAFEQ